MFFRTELTKNLAKFIHLNVTSFLLSLYVLRTFFDLSYDIFENELRKLFFSKEIFLEFLQALT